MESIDNLGVLSQFLFCIYFSIVGSLLRCRATSASSTYPMPCLGVSVSYIVLNNFQRVIFLGRGVSLGDFGLCTVEIKSIGKFLIGFFFFRLIFLGVAKYARHGKLLTD